MVILWEVFSRQKHVLVAMFSYVDITNPVSVPLYNTLFIAEYRFHLISTYIAGSLTFFSVDAEANHS